MPSHFGVTGRQSPATPHRARRHEADAFSHKAVSMAKLKLAYKRLLMRQTP